MKWDVKSKQYAEISDRIDEAISSAFRNPYLNEPQLIANLVWYLPHFLNNTAINQHMIQVGGIFIHSQPLVKYQGLPNPKNKSVELGDLLLLRTSIKNGRVKNKRALLLQAKKFDRLPTKPDNVNQHKLYAEWPTFEYVRASLGLTGDRRHITGMDVYNGTKYLFVRNLTGCRKSCKSPIFPSCEYPACTGDCHSYVTAQPTMPEITQYMDFREELLEFIFGNAGKEYLSPPPSRKRNWDKVIEDLTTITAQSYSLYMTRASNEESKIRGVEVSYGPYNSTTFHKFLPAMHELSPKIWSIVPQQEEEFEGPPEVASEWGSHEEIGAGISTIEFVVNSEG
ncbi:hypothetical protein [Maridesulfovibrio sp.]|uniref:hypothetical protein n=1 Tax=Maridesulfovibrio sp. TaxID=2795000 RepID=UPI0029C9D9B5|nr:hypothetical protein [Maridesulfovibrio sp.]